MDRKSIIILAVCFMLLMLWPQLVKKLYPPKPLQPGTTNTAAAIHTNTTTNPSPPSVAAPSLSASTTPILVVATNVPEELLVVSNENARYTFTSHGGGLKLVELVHYPETVSRHRHETQTNRFATLNTQAPAPVLALMGSENLQGDGIFKLTHSASGIRAEKTLTNGLTIVKEFRLSTNYLVEANVRLENNSAQPLALPAYEVVIGTATPLNAQDNGMAVAISWYDGHKLQSQNSSWFSSHGFMCMPREPRTEYREGASNVVWAAAQNQFFTLVAMPATSAEQVVARPVVLPPFTTDNATNGRSIPPPQGFQTALVFPAITLSANQTFDQQIHLFAGPKEYRTLARIGDRFNNEVDLVMGYGGFFGGFARALLLTMNWLHHTIYVSYGWAIVLITIVIKLLFWPLTQASTRSMKRMQALQPQMKAIADKYKDDPVKKNQKTMEFMKEHKVSPLGGCLPMLFQIPVFIGFYRMIQSAIELRGASFLWVSDLSKPDTLFMIPGFNFPFNLLPLIMGATMLWQSHLTPPSPGVDPMQQKMMKYLPLMFLVFLYNFSAGLALYWTVQNLLTIAQMKLTKAQPEAASSATAKSPAFSPPKKR